MDAARDAAETLIWLFHLAVASAGEASAYPAAIEVVPSEYPVETDVLAFRVDSVTYFAVSHQAAIVAFEADKSEEMPNINKYCPLFPENTDSSRG